MFVAMLVHGGIIAFVVLVVICLLFGDDKTKKEAAQAGGEVAGCGCLAVVGVIILLAVIAAGYR